MTQTSEDFLSNPKFDTPNLDTVPAISTLISSSASFYRTELNSNIEINIPQGIDPLSQNIWQSPDVFLPVNTFTTTAPNTIVSYPSSRDVQLLKDYKVLHEVIIQFKMEKSDGTNYINQRELRATLVNGTGVQYNQSIFSYWMPDTGSHDQIVLKGYITHYANDLVKLKLNIVQDNRLSGQSNSLLTIFRVNWNLL